MALNTLNSKLFQEVDKEKLLQLVKNHLLKPLIMRLEDQIENNRELTIKLFTRYLYIYIYINIYYRLIDELDLNSEATIILQHLAGRISGNPFPETSEEVRLQVIDLFLKIAKTYPIQVKGALSETGSMLGRAFQDPNPAMKIVLYIYIYIYKACKYSLTRSCNFTPPGYRQSSQISSFFNVKKPCSSAL